MSGVLTPYIQTYFPQSEWDRAECISRAECSAAWNGNPLACKGPEAVGYSWGPFQIYDQVWSPYINSASPFTTAQWDQVLDLNVNTWMASVVWSRSGWGAWSTCHGCEVCGVGPGAIPYPNGPVAVGGIQWMPSSLTPTQVVLGTVGVILIWRLLL